MTSQTRVTFHLSLPAFALAVLGVLTMLAPASLQAQTITVLHSFTGGDDGAYPYAGLTMDRAGNFYGTTYAGGGYGREGVVFRLSAAGSGWILTPLHSFAGGPNDGAKPFGGVTIGPDGSLYGATIQGGQHGAGTVYRLQPSPTACASFSCPWEETILYQFTGGADGGGPAWGNLIFDQAGNLYGTTSAGGDDEAGVVFKLTPSGGYWTESVIYSFPASCDSGCEPQGGLVFDPQGNLYGTTLIGGAEDDGVVYELSPSGSGWTEQTLASVYMGPYAYPYGVTMDGHGNLFGAAGGFEPGGVFELTPSNGGWTFSVVQTIPGEGGPFDTPTLDAAGNVYGTADETGLYGDGEVFKLTPSNGGWIYTSVSFDGSNGSAPLGSVVLDAAGNIYGTASLDGSGGHGTIWEITP
ncbi:MAG: choice-of-anchor tandem repeat GloVer-containing protein [Candidatus Korobacteraceae bacterium]|jgi:uncharacterized repeat protein (TIGR03803 family)